jgi:uncharacterized repeat protein (TIGR01451 family)
MTAALKPSVSFKIPFLICASALALALSSDARAANGFLYTLISDANGNSIAGFSVNEATGALATLTGFPVATGGNGSAFPAPGNGALLEMLALDRANGRLYAVNQGSNSLSAFAADRQTGALTPLPFSPISLGTGTWGSVAVHPSGSPVIVGDVAAGKARSFVVTATTATEAAGSPYSTGTAGPASSVFSPDGSFFYIGGNVGNVFAGFSVNSSTDVLTALNGSPFDSGGVFPLGYAIDSSGRLFVSTSNSPPQIRGFTFSNGIPSAFTGNPFTSGLSSRSGAGLLHFNGFYIVAGAGAHNVGVFSISGSGSATTLAPVTGSPFATNNNGAARVMALNQSGTFLYVGNDGTLGVTIVPIDPATGILGAPTSLPDFALSPIGVLAGMAYLPPVSEFVYVLNDNAAGNKIFGFSLVEDTHVLVPLPGSPFPTGGNGSTSTVSERLAIDRNNHRLFAINGGSNTVSAFNIDPLSGALSPLPFSPISLGTGSWFTIKVHPSGSPLIVGDAGSTNRIASFKITSTTATAATGSPFSTGTAKNFSSVFSRDGKFLYGGGFGSNFISGFNVNASTGVLTALSGTPLDTGGFSPVALVTDFSGNLFLASSGADEFRGFKTADGIPSLAPNSPFSFRTNTVPAHGVLSFFGSYFVADRSGNNIEFLTTDDQANLSADSTTPFACGGILTDALALNRTEKVLIAANGDSRNLTTFAASIIFPFLSARLVQPADSLGTAGRLTGLATLPPAVDLVVTITDSIDPVVAGDGAGLTYTVNITNNSPVDANSVIVRVKQILPPGVVIQRSTTNGGSFDFSSSTLSIQNIARGRPATLTLGFKVSPSTAAGTDVVTCTPTITSVNEALINPLTTTATKSTSIVRNVDLAVTAVGAPTTVVAGSGPGNLIYTLTVKNNGPSDASGVTLKDTQVLPMGVRLSNIDMSAGTFFSQLDNTWTVGALAKGASATLTLTDTVPATAATGANPVSNTITVTGANEPLINTADDTAIATTGVTFSLLSGPTAVPTTVGIEFPVVFSVLTAGIPESVVWNFGDGTGGIGTTTAHAYASPGVFTASVSITDSAGGAANGSVQVTVVAPIVGTGKDTDLDGFSDSFESAVSTDPQTAASTPFGGSPATSALPLTLVKPSIKLNFAKAGGDAIKFSGTVDVPAGFAPEGKSIFLDVGGVAKAFVLDAKGRAKAGSDSVKLSIKAKKGIVAAQTAKFSVSLSKGNFAPQLADEQLTGIADLKGVQRSVVFTFLFNNTVLKTTANLRYTSRKTKSGIAK